MSQSSWGVDWRNRPREEAVLFNPAFCGELLARSIAAYEGERAQLMHFALSFVILPLVLHSPTRAALPGRSDATFAGWAAEHAPTLAELPSRVLKLRPVSREALLFLAQHRAISVSERGLAIGDRRMRGTAKGMATSPEVDAARRAAGFTGRWFARQSSPAFVLQSLGVRP